MQRNQLLARLFIAVVIGLASTEAAADPRLNKCCPQDELFVIGFQTCRIEDDEPSKGSGQLPPVYSVDGQEQQNVTFDLRHDNLTVCPDGYVTQVSMDFKMYRDGSLKVPGISRAEEGSFCIHRIADPSASDQFAALFCVRDPCQKGVACVRKCCPAGMTVNQTNKNCQRRSAGSAPFHVNFTSESGAVLATPPAFTVRDAAVPMCNAGLMLHDPAEGDTFFILPDGRMYVPHYAQAEDRHIDEYCVDDFVEDDGASVYSFYAI